MSSGILVFAWFISGITGPQRSISLNTHDLMSESFLFGYAGMPPIYLSGRNHFLCQADSSYIMQFIMYRAYGGNQVAFESGYKPKCSATVSVPLTVESDLARLRSTLFQVDPSLEEFDGAVAVYSRRYPGTERLMFREFERVVLIRDSQLYRCFTIAYPKESGVPVVVPSSWRLLERKRASVTVEISPISFFSDSGRGRALMGVRTKPRPSDRIPDSLKLPADLYCGGSS